MLNQNHFQNLVYVYKLRENPAEKHKKKKKKFIFVCLADWVGPAFWLVCMLELNRCTFKCSAAARDYYLCHREAAVVVCTALDLFSQEFSSKALTPDEGCSAMGVVAVVPLYTLE